MPYNVVGHKNPQKSEFYTKSEMQKHHKIYLWHIQVVHDAVFYKNITQQEFIDFCIDKKLNGTSYQSFHNIFENYQIEKIVLKKIE